MSHTPLASGLPSKGIIAKLIQREMPYYKSETFGLFDDIILLDDINNKVCFMHTDFEEIAIKTFSEEAYFFGAVLFNNKYYI